METKHFEELKVNLSNLSEILPKIMGSIDKKVESTLTEEDKKSIEYQKHRSDITNKMSELSKSLSDLNNLGNTFK